MIQSNMYQLWLILMNIVGLKILQSHKRLKNLAGIKLLECRRANRYGMRAQHCYEPEFLIHSQATWFPARLPITFRAHFSLLKHKHIAHQIFFKQNN